MVERWKLYDVLQKKVRNINACICNDNTNERIGKKMTLSLLKVAINWMINGGPIMGFFICNDRNMVVLID